MPYSGKLTDRPVFKDLNFRFLAHPDTKQLMIATNAQAISQSLKNLVLSDKYERPFQSNCYGDVNSSLFENFDPITVRIIQNAVRDVINNFEPRAVLLSVQVTESIDENLDKNTVGIVVTYRPVNSKNPVVINLFLERVR